MSEVKIDFNDIKKLEKNMAYRTCFSSVSNFGYKLDILKSGVQKYLRRREYNNMCWCVIEIFKFELCADGDIENKVSNILNISFAYVEGESLIMALKDIAVSSGSACTSASLEPSYVLRALGRKDELASSSIRFSFGRFTTEEDVDYTLTLINHAVDRLRELSPLWEMYLDGIDLDTVDWQTH